MIKKIIFGACCLGILGSSTAMRNGISIYSVIDQNNIETMKNIINDPKCEFNVRGVERLLMYAVEKGKVDAVKFLLTYPDLNVNAYDDIGEEVIYGYLGPTEDDSPLFHSDINTPLYIAAKNGSSEIVKLLLQCPTLDVNLGRGSDGYPQMYDSPLCIAAKNGHAEVVKLLLTRPNIKINEGIRSPLCLAAEQGHIEVVKLLISQPEIDINKFSTYWDEEYYEQECERSATVMGWIYRFMTNETPLWFAAKNNHTDIVELLLQQPNIDVNFGNHRKHGSPLCVAVRNGNVDAVQALLAHPNIEVNARRYWNDTGNSDKDIDFSEFAIQIAIRTKNEKIMELLVSRENIKIFEEFIEEAYKNGEGEFLDRLLFRKKSREEYCECHNGYHYRYQCFLKELEPQIIWGI